METEDKVPETYNSNRGTAGDPQWGAMQLNRALQKPDTPPKLSCKELAQ
jgi:hypothetical protein